MEMVFLLKNNVFGDVVLYLVRFFLVMLLLILHTCPLFLGLEDVIPYLLQEI